MTALSAVRRGRRQALALMVETCTIKRRTGTSLDPLTDKYADTFTTVYAGQCRVKPASSEHVTESGQVAVATRRYIVSIPADSPAAVARGDVVTVTVSTDATLVGRPLTVLDVTLGELVTARRLTVEDMS